MREDSIFNAFAVTDALWKEAYRLIEAVPDAFSCLQAEISWKSEDTDRADHVCGRTGFHFEVRRLIPRQREPSQFLLVFDLLRAEFPTDWPHARDALLTFAYSPRYSRGWEVAHLAMRMDGTLLCDEARSSCVSHAGDRLLEWRGNKVRWCDRDWLFSVPLLKVDGHAAFSRNFVDPVRAILREDASPELVLLNTAAIKFNKHPHVSPRSGSFNSHSFG